MGGYGLGEFGLGSFGSLPPLAVVQALSAGPSQVLVEFSSPPDPTHVLTFDPASYVIPGLTVFSVLAEGPTTVRLVTSPQSWQAYTVTANLSLRNTSLQPIDPDARVASFTGYSDTPTFRATAQSATKVQLIFQEPMLLDTSLTNPGLYTVVSLAGVAIPVISVVPRTYLGVTARVELVLGGPLSPNTTYVVTVLAPIQTLSGKPLVPNQAPTLWVPAPNQLFTNIANFSGEVSGGLFGNPLGLVFFSPALEAAAPNSSLQVDEVTVCTKAYDEYLLPQPVDPRPFRTFGGWYGGRTNSRETVLWAPFPRMVDAKFTLADLRTESYTAVADGRCVAVITERLDPSKVSLLNNVYWQTFGTNPHPFKTAANMAPIGPGSTTTITLVPLSPTRKERPQCRSLIASVT